MALSEPPATPLVSIVAKIGPNCNAQKTIARNSIVPYIVCVAAADKGAGHLFPPPIINPTKENTKMAILYTANGHATGGRSGHGATDNGVLDVTLTTPKELGGDGATGTNPEQLFSVGYSACFLGALKFVAAKEKVKIPEDTKIHTAVGIGPRADGTGFEIDVKISAEIPGMERELAEKLVAAAHIVCPYSHAMRTSTEVPVSVR
jgi:lipoyl-dependent peroxiredoxin